MTAGNDPEGQKGRLKGFVDKIDHDCAMGWAFNPDHPDVPVILEILDNDDVIHEFAADTFREGLAEAGIGNGHHSFDIRFDPPLSPESYHEIQVRRVDDMQDLPGSGVVLKRGAARPAPPPPPADPFSIHIDHPPIGSGRADLPGYSNLFIEGWAIAENGVSAIEILLDGEPLGTATHGRPRKGVQEAFPNRRNALLSGFAYSAPRRPDDGPHAVSIVVHDMAGLVRTVSFTLDVSPRSRGPAAWSPRRHVALTERSLKLARLAAAQWHPTFLLILRLPDATPSTLAAAGATLRTLERQAYPHWKLALLLPEGEEHCRASLIGESGMLADRLAALPETYDIGAPLFLGVLREGDILGADALLELALAGIGRAHVDFLYCDELRFEPDSGKTRPFFKPDWSPELLLATNYIGRFWAASAGMFARAAISSADLAAAPEYDLVLRLTENARKITHVPKLLCARGPERLDPTEAEYEALSRALDRRGILGHLTAGCLPGYYRVKRAVDPAGIVSIIMPTAGVRGLFRTAIESLRNVTGHRAFEIIAVENIPEDDADSRQSLGDLADIVVSLPGPFNWSHASNIGAGKATGAFLLFLNDDVEIMEPDWLDALLEHAQNPEIGVVAPRLLYPDRTVQHAGKFLGETGGRNAFRFLQEDAPGQFGLALTQREVIATTGVCLMVRRNLFDTLGGFNEAHDIINNDLDFCLRAHRAGLRTIFTPYASLIHQDKASRATLDDSYDAALFAEDWAEVFAAGDPYFNPALSKAYDDYVPDPEPVEILFPTLPLDDRDEIRRILVLKLDHIGDFVTAFPALHRLKACFPNAEITMVAPSTTKALAALEPALDRVIAFDLLDKRADCLDPDPDEAIVAEALAGMLGTTKFDLAIDFRRHPETRWLLRHTGARWLAGFDNDSQFPWLDIPVSWERDSARHPKQRHVGEDMSSLVNAIDAAFGTPAKPFLPRAAAYAELAELPALSAALDGWSGHRLAAIHPAAGAENRQWPASYFASLIDLLASEENMRCLVIGGPDDTELALSVIDTVTVPDAARSIAGLVPLADLPILVQACDLFVGNNSGPQHLAAALSTPTVNIHPGIIDPREWGPIGPAAVSVRRAVSCSPCYLFRIEDCHRGLACLRTLAPRDVLNACRAVLNPARKTRGRISRRRPARHRPE